MPPISPTLSRFAPYWSSADGEWVRLYLGDVREVLRKLPARSVHTVITSPPYWGLRSYIKGGDEKVLELGSEERPDCGIAGSGKCGECFVCHMVEVFREVRRVLRDDGTCWLNLGDSYASRTDGSDGGRDKAIDRLNNESRVKYNDSRTVGEKKPQPVASGNLVGVPWRVALALQADGWILRQEIIWHKPSPMPESVRNRCTKAHEQVFLLTKSQRYFYDAEAIKERLKGEPAKEDRSNPPGWSGSGRVSGGSGTYPTTTNPTSNKRSVWSVENHRTLLDWTAENEPEALGRFLAGLGEKDDVWRIASQGYPGAHFATFPPKLVEPCLLAGTSARGACMRCGAPWRRVVVEKQLKRDRPNDYVKRTGEEGTGNSCANSVAGVESRTVGWKPGCLCYTENVIEEYPSKSSKETDEEYQTRVDDWTERWEAISPFYEQCGTVPCVVLDPFVGSGTTCDVAVQHGRYSVGIDLSKDYLDKNAVPRSKAALQECPELAHLALSGERKPPPTGGRTVARRAPR